MMDKNQKFDQYFDDQFSKSQNINNTSNNTTKQNLLLYFCCIFVFSWKMQIKGNILPEDDEWSEDDEFFELIEDQVAANDQQVLIPFDVEMFAEGQNPAPLPVVVDTVHREEQQQPQDLKQQLEEAQRLFEQFLKEAQEPKVISNNNNNNNNNNVAVEEKPMNREATSTKRKAPHYVTVTQPYSVGLSGASYVSASHSTHSLTTHSNCNNNNDKASTMSYMHTSVVEQPQYTKVVASKQGCSYMESEPSAAPYVCATRTGHGHSASLIAAPYCFAC
jgi:hypothetical protein